MTKMILGLFVALAVVGTANELRVKLPNSDGSWVLPLPPATKLTGQVLVEIRGVGNFAVDLDSTALSPLRPDVFQAGFISVFDVLARLAMEGKIQLKYRDDVELGTYMIESLNNRSGWWYDVQYLDETGRVIAAERPTSRMDHFPVRGNMQIRLYLEQPERLNAIYQSFRAEASRNVGQDERLLISQVVIDGPRGRLVFEDVEVRPHNVRSDLFRPGVITALDILLSLGEEGKIEELTVRWDGNGYVLESIVAGGFSWGPVPSCVFLHQVVATKVILPFQEEHQHLGSLIHLTPDLDVLVSPELVRWKWLCLDR